jgi:hypothetical protein
MDEIDEGFNNDQPTDHITFFELDLLSILSVGLLDKHGKEVRHRKNILEWHFTIFTKLLKDGLTGVNSVEITHQIHDLYGNTVSIFDQFLS